MSKCFSFLKFLKDLVWRLIQLKQPFAEDYVVKARLNECLDCPLNNTGKCEGCGCIIKYKVLFKDSKCPVGAWG